MVHSGSFERAPSIVFMRFRPMWGYIDKIREFCGFFSTATLADLQIADRVQLVVQELLENAVKYSENKSASDVEIEMRIERDSEDFMISVLNDGTPEMVESLQCEIATISSMDPQDAYTYAMRRLARSGSSANRLGIARIRCDGQVELSAMMAEDGRIRVEARGKK